MVSLGLVLIFVLVVAFASSLEAGNLSPRPRACARPLGRRLRRHHHCIFVVSLGLVLVFVLVLVLGSLPEAGSSFLVLVHMVVALVDVIVFS